MSNNENYVYIEYDEKNNRDKYFIGGIHEFSIQFNENTNGYIREHLEDFIRDEDNMLKLNWEGFSTLITNDFIKHIISQNDFLIKINRNLKERIELLENELCSCKNCCFFDVKEVKSVDGMKKLVCICTNEITKDYLTDLNICKYFEGWNE